MSFDDHMRLYSYKLTHDSGFAPNPFFGIMTLATCKPQMRKTKEVGDWIAGFTSKSLCGDPAGQERLIYLMQVSDKIPIHAYYFHSDFQRKIPNYGCNETIYKAGDNIYKPHGGSFIQIPNNNHDINEQFHDLSGEYVLISNKFYYFGGLPLDVPLEVRPNVPVGVSRYGSLTHDIYRARKFVEYIKANYSLGLHHQPHTWPDNDMSWKIL